MFRHPCLIKASWYVISDNYLVPSSNWQESVRCLDTAGHSMAIGSLIWRPPMVRGKVKSAVDVFGDICQTSLLHLTKAAVNRLNSCSGQMITGSEKARRGANVHSTHFRLFSIDRSLFSSFLELVSHFSDSIHYISSLSHAVQHHVVSYSQ